MLGTQLLCHQSDTVMLIKSNSVGFVGQISVSAVSVPATKNNKDQRRYRIV